MADIQAYHLRYSSLPCGTLGANPELPTKLMLQDVSKSNSLEAFRPSALFFYRAKVGEKRDKSKV